MLLDFGEFHQQFCHDTKDCEEWLEDRAQLMAQGRLLYQPLTNDSDLDPKAPVLIIRFTPEMTESIACRKVRSRGLIGPLQLICP